MGGAAGAEPDAPGYELRAAGGDRWPAVAMSERGPSRLAVLARAAVGGAGSGPAGAVFDHYVGTPDRRAQRGVPDPGEIVRVSSRRGSIEAPVRLDSGLRPGLAFMTMHFGDDVDVNVLTIDATDAKSGTAEFKATAIRVEKRDGGDRE